MDSFFACTGIDPLDWGGPRPGWRELGASPAAGAGWEHHGRLPTQKARNFMAASRV